MKKKSKIILGISAGAAALLAGGAIIAANQRPMCIYGPPESFNKNYDPSADEPVDIYGPPEAFEEEYEEEPEYDPGYEEIEVIYGPPGAFEKDDAIVDSGVSEDTISENEADTEDGTVSEDSTPEADFDPDAQVVPLIYGPPEAFK